MDEGIGPPPGPERGAPLLGLCVVNLAEALIHVTLAVVCERRQVESGERVSTAILHIGFYMLMLVAFRGRWTGWLLRCFLVIAMIFETAVWPFTGQGVTTQIILVVTDVRYIIIARPKILVYLICAFILVLLLTRLPFPKRCECKLPVYLPLVQMGAILSGLSVYRSIKASLDPFPVVYDAVPDNSLIKPYLRESSRVGSCPKSPKNIILIHVECFEMGAIGSFNNEYPNLSSNMMEIMKNGTYFDNHVMDPDKAYTMGSIFSQTSGLPMITRGSFVRGGDVVILNPRIHTYHDYLHLCGYEQVAVCTRCCTAHRLYKKHHVRPIDASQVDRLRKDEETFDYAMNVILPKLMENTSRPFSLTIVNEDTHPRCVVSERCAKNHPEWASLPFCLQAFNCFDETLANFLKRLRELGLDKTTEVIIYGDHQYYGDPAFFKPPRYITTVIPFRKEGLIKKPIKWYDLAPTILELAGIEDYEPKFPFGNSFFAKEVAPRPTRDDHIYINNMVH